MAKSSFAVTVPELAIDAGPLADHATTLAILALHGAGIVDGREAVVVDGTGAGELGRDGAGIAVLTVTGSVPA